MKWMSTVWLIGWALMFSNCSNNNAATEEESIIGDTSEAVEALPIPKVTRDLSGTMLSSFFDEEDAGKMLAIKSQFDESLCANIAYDELSDCYSTHAGFFLSDINDNIPFTSNFPYTSDFSLAKFEEDFKLLNIVSDKCGFQHVESNTAVNYICLLDKSPFMDYLEELGKSNPLVEKFHSNYQQFKGLTNEMRNDFAVSPKLQLDFEQVDHQLFYMMVHLSINDELIASRKLQQLN